MNSGTAVRFEILVFKGAFRLSKAATGTGTRGPGALLAHPTDNSVLIGGVQH